MQKDLTVQNALKLDIGLFGEPKNYDEERGSFNRPYSASIGVLDRIGIAQSRTETMAELNELFIDRDNQLCFVKSDNALSYEVNKTRIDKATGKPITETIKCSVKVSDTHGKSANIVTRIRDISFKKFNEAPAINEKGNEVIVISEQELIDYNIYATTKSMKAGIRARGEELQDTKLGLEGTDENGKMMFIYKPVFQAVGYLEGKGLVIERNGDIQKNFLFTQYVPTPFYLPYIADNKAYELLKYLCVYAKTGKNQKKSVEQGCIKLTFKAIQDYLKLPTLDSPLGKKHASDKILQPLLEALDEIERVHSLYFKEPFKIKRIYNRKAKAKDIILNGYIEYVMPDNIQEQYIENYKKREEAKAKEQRRRENIQDKAIAINLAKKMERKEAEPKPQEEYTQTSIDDITII